MSDWYLWIKAFHIMAVISWMAGLFYLPRLFVYHSMEGSEGPASKTFKVMEYKLYRYIMVPAMLVSWIAGSALIYIIGFSDIWLHVKIVAVLLMTGFHFLLGYHLKEFRSDNNQRDQKYFRLINEIPTILMAFIVIMVVVKPF